MNRPARLPADACLRAMNGYELITFGVQRESVISEIYGKKRLRHDRSLFKRGSLLTPTFCKSKFRPLPLCMTLLLILLTAVTFKLVFVPVVFVSLLLLFIWLESVQIFSLGLSLPTETGLGLSEQGEASRDTDSESSSLNGFPVIVEFNRITSSSLCGESLQTAYLCLFRPSYRRGLIPSIC